MPVAASGSYITTAEDVDSPVFFKLKPSDDVTLFSEGYPIL